MLITYLSFSILFLSVWSSKIVDTSYGQLKGITYLSDQKNHKYIFKSIPFAKPPVGNLRFALPQDPESWNGVRDATKYSAACMSNFTMTRFRQKKLSEDCLYINIFTSENCLTKKCPVIIYYHGGTYRVDSAVMFPDQFILEKYVSEDVVFAIPAYRLGAFGQLYFGPNGVLNAVKSIHYVHNEIANFGGDPSRVTVMGHSAGATLVIALGFSKLIDPNRILFQQIISFSAHGEFGFYDLAIDNAFELAEKLGCILKKERNNFNITETLECLRKVDKLDIMKVQSEMVDSNRINFKSIIKGAPFIELNGKVEDLKRNPPARNIICGTTELEFRKDVQRMYSAGTFLDFRNPRDVVNHYYDLMNGTDLLDPLTSGVYISARTYSEAMTAAGANAYIYETVQKPESVHTADMQYFIGIHREKVHTTDMDILDSFYSKMLVNFTKTGVPSPEWQKLDPAKMNYLELKVDSESGEGPVMKERFHDKEYEYWFGAVMEYDRNLTNLKISQDSHLPNTVAEVRPIQADNQKTTETISNSVLKQWWFYPVILVLLIIAVLAFLSCRKFRTEESIPLLR